jgi:glycosyltransferase involved in cell wall biosynthesis
MTTIAVICPGPPECTPSTYYRFGQYKDLWREQGAELIFVPKQELSCQAFCLLEKADIIVNQKCLLSSQLFRRIKSLGKPLFFDLDDLIWHRAGKDYSCFTKWKVNRRLALWAKGVHRVISANSFIQERLLVRTGTRAALVQMSLDLDTWCQKSDHLTHVNGQLHDDTVRVGWTGSPEYHWLLRKLVPVLREAQKQENSLRFSIHSGLDPQLECDYEFVQWRKGNEPNFVKSLDIGLLPMDSSSIFSLGKSPIKGLQYLACGVVPVGNFCGASRDYLSTSNSLLVDDSVRDWAEQIVEIARHKQTRSKMQLSGISFIKENHDSRRVGSDLLVLLRDWQ